MAAELHLCPERLRGHAIAALRLSEELAGALWRVPEAAGAFAAERERLLAVVRAAAGELEDLGRALGIAAAAAAAAEDEARRGMGGPAR